MKEPCGMGIHLAIGVPVPYISFRDWSPSVSVYGSMVHFLCACTLSFHAKKTK